MKTATPGTIVFVDKKVYVVKKKLGIYTCCHCALFRNCKDYLEDHMFVKCFDFLFHNHTDSETSALILRSPFQLTKESIEKEWPIHSVIEWDGKVGIVVERDEMREALLPFACKDCILRRANCENFPCMPNERKDRKNIEVLSIEWAHKLKRVKVINTKNDND